MNSAFRKLRLTHQLMAIIMANLAICLIVVSVVVTLRLNDKFREDAADRMFLVGAGIAANSAAALLFDDRAAASNTLDLTLRGIPQVRTATILDKNRNLFVGFAATPGTAGQSTSVESLLARGGIRKGEATYAFADDALVVVYPVMLKGERLGEVQLVSDMSELREGLRRFNILIGGLAVLSLTVSALLSSWLQRLVTQPIHQLILVMRRVSEDAIYGLRAPKIEQAELGALTTGFNTMLGRIETEIAQRKASEERYRALFSHMQGGFTLQEIITDEAGRPVDYRFLEANQSFLNRHGVTLDELIGRTQSQVFPDASKDATDWVAIYGEVVRSGNPVTFEAYSSLTRQWSEYTAYRTAPGQFAVLATDVTEKRQAEAMLRESQKMEAIGTLAGGIAHDFNNILTTILGFNHLILDDLGDQEAVASHVGQVRAAAIRAKDLVRQILTYSRQVPSKNLPVDLCQTVNEIYRLIRTTAPANVKLSLALPSGAAMVLGTASALDQVVMNLCVNAIDAIGERDGTIAIAVERAAGSFQLAVTDSGSGVPAEIRSRIFDPFFTTKSTGKGTGLGLSVVRGIVEDLGGTIALENPAAGGARFVVRLPECASAVEAGSSEKAPAAPRLEGQTWDMLVVDDQPTIVEPTRQYFTNLGHRVTACSLPAEALDWIRAGRRFDVVITDQMMPEVRGIDLARAVAEHLPEAKVVLCSGRDDNLDADEMAAAKVDGFILKPFDLEELAEMVQRLLEGEP